MKKTLILVPDLKQTGGVTNYYNTLRLDEENDISYFAITAAKPQGALAASLRLVTKYFKFVYRIVAGGYQVVMVNPSLDMGRSFHRDLIFIMLSHLFNKKTIVFFRGWFEPYEFVIKKSPWKLFLFKISYARAGKYIVLGNIFKNKLTSLGVPKTTEFFIETTVANSSYVAELDLSKKFSTYNSDFRMLFLSRVEKEKGIYIAVDAFKTFIEKFPERKCSLVIAGDGPELAAVKKYVAELNVSGVAFLGHVSSGEKKKVLLESHLMIFPSFTEGLPNSILEGMLYGMPIIARATGGIPEVVHNNTNGFVTESYDSSEFTNFLEAIATDEDVYKRMAESNHAIALEKFTSEKVRKRIIHILSNTQQLGI